MISPSESNASSRARVPDCVKTQLSFPVNRGQSGSWRDRSPKYGVIPQGLGVRSRQLPLFPLSISFDPALLPSLVSASGWGREDQPSITCNGAEFPSLERFPPSEGKPPEKISLIVLRYRRIS